MRRIAAVLLFGAITGSAGAEDELQYYDNAGKRVTVRGKIVDETTKAVVIERTGGKKESIPVNAIDQVRYDEQPAELVQTRTKERQGRFQDAYDDYMKIGQLLPENKPYLSAAVAFGAFRMAAELAVVDPSKADNALKIQQTFVQAFPQSRHHYAMQEYLGRIYLAKGDYSAAAAALAKLAEVDWPGYREKATVYQGIAALKQKRLDEAIKFFDQVLGATGDDDAVLEQKNLAQVYKGECLVQGGKAAEAETLLRKALAEIDPEAYEVRAIGHNALGDALRAAGKPKEAMLAGYMWVNVIYNQFPDQLARALFNLAQVFREIGQPERAQQIVARLQAEFPNSEWTRRLTSGS
jgi:tetratricopeptide (TPR) repeat protein